MEVAFSTGYYTSTALVTVISRNEHRQIDGPP